MPLGCFDRQLQRLVVAMRGRLELAESAQRMREVDLCESLEPSIAALSRQADGVGRVVFCLLVAVTADRGGRHPRHALREHRTVLPSQR